jgi:(R,R)-butanediol dehydrogenase/meso-butanediol dehydrogenase/diacetyl reductase
MRAALYHGPRDIRVEDVPPPGEPGTDDVLIDVEAVSVCGTDLSEYLHGPHMIPLSERHPASGHAGPTIIGHEFAGVVAAVGGRVTNLRVGDRVVPGAGSWCGRCARCLEGRPNLCERYFVYGLHANGGMAEQALVPRVMCHVMSDDLDWVSAAMAQPAAIALHAIARGSPAPRSSVVIIGAGGIGGFLVAAAAARDLAHLIVVDINEERLSRASKLGATTTLGASHLGLASEIRALTGGGADLVVEASGTPAGLSQALASVRKGGRVLLVGIQGRPVSVDLAPVVVHEIEIVTTNGHVCDVDLPAALDLLASSAVKSVLLGDVVPLADVVPGGFEAMAAGTSDGKIVVRIKDV